MPCRMIEHKRRYIIISQVGHSTGWLRKLLFWYWERKTRYMTWSEILDMYRLLTER